MFNSMLDKENGSRVVTKTKFDPNDGNIYMTNNN